LDGPSVLLWFVVDLPYSSEDGRLAGFSGL
jgi:hypothetical protein